MEKSFQLTTTHVPFDSETSPDCKDMNNPFSAFYAHPATRSSLERAKSDSQVHLPLYDSDIEAGKGPTPVITLTQTSSNSNLIGNIRRSQDVSLEIKRQEESSMWPSMQTLKKRAKEERKTERMRTWMCLGSLNRQQRLATKIVILLLVLAAAVGVGVGISVAVHGSVYHSNGQSQPIPEPHKHK